MIKQQNHRTRGWTRLAKLAAAGPLIQFAGCAVADLQQAMIEGAVQSITGDVFTVAQTILLNVFRV